LKNAIIKVKGKIFHHKILIQNFSYLSALQIFNLVLPFVTYPYLIRVVGINNYGLVVFAQAVVGYLLPMVNFGFNITAVQEVSLNRDNKGKLDEIVSGIFIIKTILFIISLIILGLSLYFIPSAQGHELLFLLTMGICLNDVLFPVWYFQGIEQMKYITSITIYSRVISIILIFILITKPTDYILIPLINGIAFLVSSFSAIYIIFIRHKITFSIQKLDTLKKYIKGSLPIFISNLSSSLYGSSNKVILGTFLGIQDVAYYDIAEKITTVFRFPQSIMLQSIFPKIAKEKNFSFIKSIFRLSMFSNVLIFAFILLSSKYLIIILGGQQMLPAHTITNILAFTLPLIALSSSSGFLVLIPFGLSKSYSKVIIGSFFFYLIQIVLIFKFLGISLLNIAFIAVATECFIATSMFYLIFKHKLWSPVIN
jgi:PST family polysaccharide transporter